MKLALLRHLDSNRYFSFVMPRERNLRFTASGSVKVVLLLAVLWSANIRSFTEPQQREIGIRKRAIHDRCAWPPCSETNPIRKESGSGLSPVDRPVHRVSGMDMGTHTHTHTSNTTVTA